MKRDIFKVIGLGLVAGMRITFGPAFLSHYFNKDPKALRGSNFSFLSKPRVARIAKVQLALEIITDKNPYAPDRTGIPQIFLRIASGGFIGAAIAVASKQTVFKYLLIGCTSALAGTYLAFHTRTLIDKKLQVNDFYTGALEDVLALGAAALLTK